MATVGVKRLTVTELCVSLMLMITIELISVYKCTEFVHCMSLTLHSLLVGDDI